MAELISSLHLFQASQIAAKQGHPDKSPRTDHQLAVYVLFGINNFGGADGIKKKHTIIIENIPVKVRSNNEKKKQSIRGNKHFQQTDPIFLTIAIL